MRQIDKLLNSSFNATVKLNQNKMLQQLYHCHRLHLYDKTRFRSIENLTLDWNNGVNLAYLVESLAPGSWDNLDDVSPDTGLFLSVLITFLSVLDTFV